VFYFICNWYNALVLAYAGHFIVMKLNSGKGGVGLLYRFVPGVNNDINLHT